MVKKIFSSVNRLGLLIPSVYADNTTGPGGGTGTAGANCSGLRDCLSGIAMPGLSYSSETGLVGRILGDILPIVLGIAGFITVIIIIISGIQFIISNGNPEGAAAARGRLVFAIVGFVVIVLAFAILQIINRIFLGTTIV